MKFLNMVFSVLLLTASIDITSAYADEENLRVDFVSANSVRIQGNFKALPDCNLDDNYSVPAKLQLKACNDNYYLLTVRNPTNEKCVDVNLILEQYTSSKFYGRNSTSTPPSMQYVTTKVNKGHKTKCLSN